MSVFIAVGLLLIAVTSAGAQPRIVDFGNGVYQAGGAVPLGTEIRVPQSNTFVVTTSDGRVVIDTSGPGAGPAHRKALDAVGQGPVRAIILTHAHGDHTAGISAWKQPETRVIAHRAYPEFLEYTDRLAGYFARANAAQFGGALGALPAKPGALQRPPAPVLPDVLFDTTHTLTVGDTSFEILHTPGETPDHLTVWVPRLKAAFVGDNYYESFPNLYTLRGTRPRWALEYVASLDRVLALEPEVVLPSHGEAIRGRDEVKRRLTRYRDAIKYVHDETVRGMNEGKDVLTLMREIKLPAHLDLGESYGRLTWSIRGIYEGYVGWYDGNVSTMFGPPSQAYGVMAGLAGGADAVAARAAALAIEDPVTALYLTDMALAADARHRGALEARIQALQTLIKQSNNSNERGWLAAGLRDAERRLK
jgi:alkyl sulfatase BDS1-like metallo-beta-lactamase superfamily hydrolase